jgi:hypothetical protein
MVTNDAGFASHITVNPNAVIPQTVVRVFATQLNPFSHAC